MLMFFRCLILISVFPLFSGCGTESALPCQSDALTCVRVQNDSGVDLRGVRLRMNAAEGFTSLADIDAGETSEFATLINADWCEYRLEALDTDLGVYVGGGWMCGQPDPLGAGAFTVVLTPGAAVPAQYSYLESELIR